MAAVTELNRRMDESQLLQAFDSALSDILSFPTEVSIRMSGPAPLDWLHDQAASEKFYWMDRDDRGMRAGWGVAGHVSRLPDESTSSVVARCRTMIGGTSARMVGGFAFTADAASTPEWSAFGPGAFWLPRIVYDGHAIRIFVQNAQDVDRARRALAECWNHSRRKATRLPRLQMRRDVPDRAGWLDALAQCQQLFEAEVLEKIVLVRQSQLHFAERIDPLALLRQLGDELISSYAFCIAPNPSVAYLGVSPERLFARSADRIYSEVVAGTRARRKDAMGDPAAANELLHSKKDQLEHDIVRKSIRQRLHGFVDELVVDSTARILALSRVIHLYSAVHGRVLPEVDDGVLLDRLHPTPALGGYPTENALAEIARLEPFRRGWYGGPVGWISRDAVEFAVGIRSALVTPERMLLFAGAGIVPGSTAEGEWDEVEHKMEDYLRLVCLQGE